MDRLTDEHALAVEESRRGIAARVAAQGVSPERALDPSDAGTMRAPLR